MELRHLRYYVAVAEERHFRRAAERLHIAQPPLSQQIKHLEAELGVQLLRRTTRSVEPTAAGLRFLDRARDILAAVEDAAAESRLVADGHVGRVALGFTGSATYELLPSLSRALGEELPGIELELHGELLTPDQEARLLDGSLDVGFLRPPVRSHDISVFSLRREPLVAVVPATHHAAGATSVSLADLATEPFVTYPSQHRSVVHDTVVAACRAAGFVPRATEVSETSTLVSFVAAGRGVAVVPASVQHLQITGATYVPLAGPVPSVELAVATRREVSPVVRRVLHVVRAQMT